MRLGLCAIVQNEGPYLAEWLAHYRTQGVTTCALYDNGSTDGGLTALGPDVTVTPWPGHGVQIAAYQHALGQWAVDWLLIVDADEFWYAPDGRTVADVLDAQPAAIEAIWAPWRMFGFGGHETRPAGGVVDSYRWRARDDHPVHDYASGGKSIVRPRRVQAIRDPHHVRTAGGPPATTRTTGLLVNHYWTKSRAEFQAKVARGRADGMPERPWAAAAASAAEYGEVYDETLARRAA